VVVLIDSAVVGVSASPARHIARPTGNGGPIVQNLRMGRTDP